MVRRGSRHRSRGSCPGERARTRQLAKLHEGYDEPTLRQACELRAGAVCELAVALFNYSAAARATGDRSAARSSLLEVETLMRLLGNAYPALRREFEFVRETRRKLFPDSE